MNVPRPCAEGGADDDHLSPPGSSTADARASASAGAEQGELVMTERIAPADLRPHRTMDVGPVRRSRPVRVFIAAVVGAAVVGVVLSTLLSGHRPAGDRLSALAGAGLATLLVGAGQLARLRFQLGRGTVSVS